MPAARYRTPACLAVLGRLLRQLHGTLQDDVIRDGTCRPYTPGFVFFPRRTGEPSATEDVRDPALQGRLARRAKRLTMPARRAGMLPLHVDPHFVALGWEDEEGRLSVDVAFHDGGPLAAAPDGQHRAAVLAPLLEAVPPGTRRVLAIGADVADGYTAHERADALLLQARLDRLDAIRLLGLTARDRILELVGTDAHVFLLEYEPKLKMSGLVAVAERTRGHARAA